MTIELTRELARFAAGVRYENLPERAVLAARLGFTDCVGVMIAGAAEESPRRLSAFVSPVGTGPSAPEIPSGRAVSPGDAALVNGTAAHVLDYDDVAINGHTSAVIVPALLAWGWQYEVSGADAMAAYVAGYEVWACLAGLETSHLHDRGFHPTAIYGTVAAAAACARLAKLDEARTLNAISIAASMASGLVGNFGTMVKSLHAGRAAQSGVIASALALEGFAGAPNILEQSSGFMQAHHQTGFRVPVTTDLPSKRLRIEQMGVNLKRYPTCYATHRSIDATLELAATHGIRPEQVACIEVHTGATQMVMLSNHEPRTGLEAKFSMEFALACALTEGRVSLAELTDETACRPDLVALMAKVQCTTTDETMLDLPFAPEDRVGLVLDGGEVLEAPPVTHAKGSWQRPMSDAELWEKFRDCTSRQLSSSHSESLFEQLCTLQSVERLSNLQLVAKAG